jgi:SPP1 gp7 family putative phage head morphogenesis protein
VTPSAYLREIALAITRAEDLIDKEAQVVLYDLALRIYTLLITRLPGTSIERQLFWLQLLQELLQLLTAASDAIAELLYAQLLPVEVTILTTTFNYYGFPNRVIPPRPRTEVLERTEVLTTPLARLFSRDATGISPFARQLLRLLERSVLAATMRDLPTADVAAVVIGTRTRAGRTIAVPRKGTVANAWRERTRAITAAALWGLVTPSQERVSTTAAAEGIRTSSWQWVAVLDPRTCPVCRPLDGTTAPSPAEFPRGAPPLHPLCRCIVIPTLTR